MVQDPTTFDGWSGSNMVDPLTRLNFGKVKKSVTDVSAMSPDIMAIAVFWAFYIVIEVRFIKSKDRNDILQSFD